VKLCVDENPEFRIWKLWFDFRDEDDEWGGVI